MGLPPSVIHDAQHGSRVTSDTRVRGSRRDTDVTQGHGNDRIGRLRVAVASTDGPRP
jgi:hypothetical protein